MRPSVPTNQAIGLPMKELELPALGIKLTDRSQYYRCSIVVTITLVSKCLEALIVKGIPRPPTDVGSARWKTLSL